MQIHTLNFMDTSLTLSMTKFIGMIKFGQYKN